MADPKTINELTNRATLVATDEMEVQVSGETSTKKAPLSALKTLVIGSATIGGNAAGDILTTDAAQTLTGVKTIVSPVITTAATLPAATTIGNISAAELLILDGLLSSTAELNYSQGLDSNIQDQINALEASAGSITKKVFTYGVNYTTAGAEATKTITAATILADLAITGYLMNPQSVIATVYTNPGAGVYNSMDTGTTIRINTTTSAGVERVSNLVFSGLSTETAYMFIIHYSIVSNPT